VNWYRREPDQMQQHQVQWCHGAPGIGLFYAELARLTGDDAHLATARGARRRWRRRAATTGRRASATAVGRNAELFLALPPADRRRRRGSRRAALRDVVWSRRLRGSAYPAWKAGDGSDADNPGLMTGTAGVGWLYLQLAGDGRLGGPVTP
jgi:hypothetical protein